MEFVRDVEKNSVSLRLRKAFTDAEIASHTVLTDDVFSYVDFYFKTHKKTLREASGKPLEANHIYYWQQARNFYNAAKILPIDASPLPMYYCMLNATKAFLFYSAIKYDDIKDALGRHGLHECQSESEVHILNLDSIYVQRDNRGVFPQFARMLHPDFATLWPTNRDGSVSLKQLLYHLPFVHSSYISTYGIARRDEKFVPLKANTSPRFMYSKDNKIRLVVDLDRNYFKQNATTIPDDVKCNISDSLMVNDKDKNKEHFQLVSSGCYKKKEIQTVYNMFRRDFSYIAGDKRIWYLKKKKMGESDIENINSMVLEIAAVHRFSEIVRYKPEQMIKLLNGKENWIIHEFLSMVLDQFMDEITCEITKQEIMPTRIK